MSSSRKDPKERGYNPAQTRVTLAELQEYWAFFRKVSENKWVVPAVIVAGIGAAMEIIHILWLAARYLLKF